MCKRMIKGDGCIVEGKVNQFDVWHISRRLGIRGEERKALDRNG